MVKFCSKFVLSLLIFQVYGDVAKYFCNSVNYNIKCDPLYKYRSIDGTCNNLQNPHLGAANTRLRRITRSTYSDNISSPPKSVTGSELPSARLVSLTVFNNQEIPSFKFTQATAQFAQFFAHDFSNVPKNKQKNGCCTENGKLAKTPDSSCMYIKIPPGDTLHAGQECMDFVRSVSDNDIKCQWNSKVRTTAQQINSATSFLDLSHVYGTDRKTLKQLRSFKNGKIKLITKYNQTWPTQACPIHNVCFKDSPKETCFFSGDSRMNQGPQLAIMTILFMREHNRIATELKNINPHWSDEVLFQEARRINIAQYQNIFFYGFYAAVATIANLRRFGYILEPTGGNYANVYNSSVDPTLLNEFVAGMFRIPHTLIYGHLSKLSESQALIEKLRLSDAFYRPKYIEGYGNFENLLRGMIFEQMLDYDKQIDDEVRSYLFRKNKAFGMDLKAIDIQRGRDHGLGTFNDMRVFCGLPRATKWEDFLDQFSQEDIDNLKKVYTSVDDVDMTVGANLEKAALPGTFFGHTYAFLLKYQLEIIRSSDRFWFETADPVIRFTPEQLTEIRKSSISRIICDNGGNIQSVPLNSFRLLNVTSNPLTDCSAVPKVDLSFFRDPNPPKGIFGITLG